MLKMMKRFVTVSMMAALLVGAASVGFASSVQDILKVFPAAQHDYKQSTIILPALANEGNYKVEIVVGKTMAVDCNRTWLTGELVKEDIAGYGYSYYTVKGDVLAASTRMWCGEGKTEKKFVSMNDTELIAYNSRMPIVVYAPKDLEVKYKVWSTNDKAMPANEVK